nr:hypothetical protein CFP56_15105 [Quercus suber]
MDEVERMLICQRHRIQRLYQVPFAFDSIEPQFHNELRAYFNKRRRWTTRARYGNRDTENYSQDHPSPVTVNPEPIQAPVPTPNQSTSASTTPQTSHLHQDFEHASLHSAILSLSINRGTIPPTPANSPNSTPEALCILNLSQTLHATPLIDLNLIPNPHTNMHAD